jgi:hypothetical protein
MKRYALWLALCIACPIVSANAQSGVAALAACNDQTVGYMHNLIADRLEAKLGQSPSLSAAEREIWLADIKALRAVTRGKAFVPPNRDDPQHFLLGLSDPEQRAINSMQIRRVQDVQIQCELEHGGFARRTTEDDPYIVKLRSQLVTPTDIATVAITALPSPIRKSREELAAEERAAQQQAVAAQQAAARQALANQAQVTQAATANLQNIAGKAASCQAESQGVQMTMRADAMQRKLDAATGLSAKERADFEADIRSIRDAGAAGQALPQPIDPANPMRAFSRLSPQEQMAIVQEFSATAAQFIQQCMAR